MAELLLPSNYIWGAIVVSNKISRFCTEHEEYMQGMSLAHIEQNDAA